MNHIELKKLSKLNLFISRFSVMKKNGIYEVFYANKVKMESYWAVVYNNTAIWIHIEANKGGQMTSEVFGSRALFKLWKLKNCPVKDTIIKFAYTQYNEESVNFIKTEL